MPEFSGIRVSQDINACTQFLNVHHVRVEPQCNEMMVDEPGMLGGGGNSGFQALNLLVQFGVRRLVLVGFDMRIDLGRHWHGDHSGDLNNPNHRSVMRWRRALDGAAGRLAELGVEVVNTSADSALTAYPVRSLMEAI